MLNDFFNVSFAVIFITLIMRTNSGLASFNDNDKKRNFKKDVKHD